jgi:hypothetical protein
MLQGSFPSRSPNLMIDRCRYVVCIQEASRKTQEAEDAEDPVEHGEKRLPAKCYPVEIRKSESADGRFPWEQKALQPCEARAPKLL